MQSASVAASRGPPTSPQALQDCDIWGALAGKRAVHAEELHSIDDLTGAAAVAAQVLFFPHLSGSPEQMRFPSAVPKARRWTSILDRAGSYLCLLLFMEVCVEPPEDAASSL